MEIKKLVAKSVKNSRGELTIQIIVKTSLGKFVTSAPSGKSKGRYEVRAYFRNLKTDISTINKLDTEALNKLNINSFEDLKKIERIIKNKIGANSLFALEASLLKALARENGKELWEFLGGRKFKIQSVGNAVEGGMHSKGIKGKKPDFQEFLFIADCKTFRGCVKTNKKAYKLVKKFLKSKQKTDEGAYVTDKNNEQVLEIMKKVQEIIKNKYDEDIKIGIDIAGSSFYKNLKYVYKNNSRARNKREQIEYVSRLTKKYNLYYIEDPLNENDFSGFAELKRKTKCFIVGDDLTTTNPERLKKAIRMRAINGIIIKPNQIGSLLKVKEVVELAHKYNIKTIMSHRSGETKDNTIADLAVGFGCNFIKTGIYGSVRESKLKRVVGIERGL